MDPLVNSQRSVLPDTQTKQPLSESNTINSNGRTYSLSSKADSFQKIKDLADRFFTKISQLYHKANNFIRNESVTINNVDTRLPHPKNVKLRSSDLKSKGMGGKSLNKLLEKPFGLTALIQESEKSRTSENVHFLHSLKHLSELISDNKEGEATHVWNDIKKSFLDEASPLYVNLPGNMNENFLRAGDSLFSKDFREMHNVIQKDIEELIGTQLELMKDSLDQADALEAKAHELNRHLSAALNELGLH